MELYIKERFYIPQMLPQQNTFMEFGLKRSILNKVEITEKDKKEYNIQEDQENNRITWDYKKDKECPLVVEFTEEETKFLKKSCEKLSEVNYPDDFWVVVEKIYNAANK